MDYNRQKAVLRNPATGYVDENGRCVPRRPSSTDASAANPGLASPPAPPGKAKGAGVLGRGLAGAPGRTSLVDGWIRRAIVTRHFFQAGGPQGPAPGTIFVVEVEMLGGDGGGAWVCYKR